MDKTISIYVRNSKFGPSDYYRVIQYIDFFENDWIVHDAVNPTEFQRNLENKPGIKKKIYQLYLFFRIYIRRFHDIQSDIKEKRRIIIIQREIFPHLMGPIAGMLIKKLLSRTKVIWDFDDDIFLNGEICERERIIVESFADDIVVTSKYLKELLHRESREKTIVLSTTDGFCNRFDLEELYKKRMQTYDAQINLVWVGTAVNLHNLDLVIEELDNAAEMLKTRYDKKLVLSIVCNREFVHKAKALMIVNIPWTRSEAEETIANSHIGIMPLIESKYALGKGGFKIVQYISMGIPVIASAVGYNKEIIRNEFGYAVINGESNKWMNALSELSCNKEKWIAMSKSARERYENSFSFEDHSKIWNKLISE